MNSLFSFLILVVAVRSALISKDCSQIGSSAFFLSSTLDSSNAAYGQYSCSPKQCTMVTNTAATAPTPSPAECTFTTGTCTGTTSYGFSKDNVFKNMVKKTCDADVTAAAYPNVCSRTALAKNFMLGASSGSSGKAHLESGIRLLYCNDQYLVIHTVNVPNHPVGLLGNPHPPGSGCNSAGSCSSIGYDQQTVTRTNMVQYSVYKIPLVPQDLGTSSAQNNKARFAATFSAKLSVATTALVAVKGELTFAAATSGNIHAGYIITGTGVADKTALSSCDSAEIVAGTAGVSSTTFTIAWTVVGTVCSGSKVASTCVDGASNGKYVKIGSAYVQLKSCSIKGGAGTCTLDTAQTVATGTTLQVFDSSTGATVKCLISEATTATIATSVTITGTHNTIYDLPSFATSNSPKAGIDYPGIPIYGPLAVSVTGQVLYPIYDDQGFTSQEMCEVDMCNGHAGKGFDYHHHGDPYHHTPGKCLYSPKDYTDTVYGHPPLIGYSLDGYKVYGRHLNETNIGYSTALDDCGGHSHGSGTYATYHYHAQVLKLDSINGGGTATSTLSTKAGGSTSYYAPIPGVYKCWRGDIGAQRLFGNQIKFDDRAEFEDLKPCENTKHYWRHESLIAATEATALAAAFDQFTSTGPSFPTPSTPSPTTTQQTLSFTLSSSLTASQISSSSALQTALKSAIAVMLEIDVSAVTSITVVSARRQAHVDRRNAEADWREEQKKDVARLLGYGLEVDSESGLVRRVGSHNARTRKMVTSSVTVTATVVSQYSASQLSSAYTAYSSAFTYAFAYAAASNGFSLTDGPSLAPTTAPSGLSSTNKIIIGVVVGVGGAILIAGAIYAAVTCSSSSTANNKMPVESSAHHKSGTGGEDYSGGEVEVLAISHGDHHHGAVDAEPDTWQTVQPSGHHPAAHANPHPHHHT